MELQFKKEGVSWLECPVREVRNLEQTLELKLTDGMPDVWCWRIGYDPMPQQRLQNCGNAAFAVP